MATVLGSKRKEDKGKAVYSTAPLPLGFEFNPTDEQLIDHYLRLKNAGRESEVQIIGEVDFYDYEPWDLPELSVIKSDQLDWFFFCRRHAKEQSTSSIWTMVFSRPNRATAAGYWETTGDDCPIRSTKSSAFGLIGLKKTLVFYEGRAPNGTRTDWIMHEYRATEGDLAGTSPHQDDFVLCRLFQKVVQFDDIDGDTIYHTGLYTDPYTGPGLSLSTTNSSYAGPGLALSTTNSSYAGPGLCLSTTNSSYADPSNLSADPSDLTEEAVPQREDSSLDLCLNFSTQGILLRDAIAEAKCEGVVYEIEAESSLKAFAKQDLCLNSSTPSILLREAFAEEGIEKRITSESQGEVFEVEAVEMKSNSREKFGEIEAEIKFLQDMKFEIEEIGLEPETSEMDWKTFSMGLEIYSDPIIQREVLQSCLMWGGLGLTKPPKDEDWENAKMIYLMDNELSVLPKNPRCPLLSTLFLQRNYKLRTIPPSFFDYMPALQILNLSRTGIKSLPESILRLVSLKRLFLNDCHRFMILSPKVGELKRLEILDLEGTDIMDLPKEIKELTNLTCLEVSLYADLSNGRRAMQSAVVVPCGIISALSHLEELNINVNPDDKRWNACVEAIVTEVCTLESLNTLKFYFPRVENVRHFLLNSPMWVNPSLSHFRFTVGHHVTRIISRLPRDVEFELERWERCLKYINGVAVPREIKRVLQYSTAFFLERHATVKKLSDFGIGNMKQLKCCVVGECNEVEVIIYETDAYEENNEADAHEEDDEVDACEEDDSNEIVSKTSGAKKIVLGSLEYLCIYYMKNLRRIWEGPVQPKSLSLLKFLTLHTCPELTTVFTKDLLDNLYNLEELTIEDCPSIETLVSCEVCAEHKTSHFLPNLKRISLHYMPKLDTISSGLHIAPRLEWLSLYNCPNLKNPLIEELSSKDLKKIKGERSWWEALEWESGCPAYLDDIFVPINIWDC